MGAGGGGGAWSGKVSCVSDTKGSGGEETFGARNTRTEAPRQG